MLIKNFRFLGFCLCLMVLGSYARAEEPAKANGSDWGEMGYNNTTVNPQVEQMPESIPPSFADHSNSKPAETIPTEPERSPLLAVDPMLTDDSQSASNISTVKNSYGVMTEENKPAQLYASPFGGMAAFTGNSTVNTSPGPSFGVNLGVLISSQLMIEAGYIYSQQSVSNPLTGNRFSPDTNVFDHKQSQFDLGGKLFFLGRESRFRPFFGGGMGYSRSTLNYSSNVNVGAFQTADFVTNNMTAYGEVGAEFAFTRAIVAMAMFKFDGVVSSNSSADDSLTAQSLDANKMTVGSALSKSSAYMIGAGLGIYF